MARFPSLPENAHLSDALKHFPNGIKPLLEYHDAILRGESELTIAERELIAAYVSGLNACNFCAGSHQIIAEVHGIDAFELNELIADPEKSGVSKKMLPILNYVKKLTLTPARMVDADADAVYAAKWSEDSLFTAISVCSLFNLMNRIVEGTGIQTNDAAKQASRSRHEQIKESKTPYQDFGRMIGVIEQG